MKCNQAPRGSCALSPAYLYTLHLLYYSTELRKVPLAGITRAVLRTREISARVALRAGGPARPPHTLLWTARAPDRRVESRLLPPRVAVLVPLAAVDTRSGVTKSQNLPSPMRDAVGCFMRAPGRGGRLQIDPISRREVTSRRPAASHIYVAGGPSAEHVLNNDLCADAPR
ncbi:hypothetical protein EVAR_5527_1 [Eumeta japonica]|uniref:Uncharacterized protein n=1 Tax=Eumeta variegata TaxID=151549 RepID=A0A4C1TCD8_EUMVA|nr:hypothetical protein EVAR_5527_1 [Eumeta japonica]